MVARVLVRVCVPVDTCSTVLSASSTRTSVLQMIPWGRSDNPLVWCHRPCTQMLVFVVFTHNNNKYQQRKQTHQTKAKQTINANSRHTQRHHTQNNTQTHTTSLHTYRSHLCVQEFSNPRRRLQTQPCLFAKKERSKKDQSVAVHSKLPRPAS